ncbi:hypothetical protein O1611_g5008 [Lasiodiplodia mahajangana]|uniref:Uncharacterized protein n=1 Tax=Lasiodiplodia mahajangana TaxID=1108764 RepID=A0ACC2JMQ9_9PEZI|nr:hypothetical protein O1611_g5008 [Lasiodiplodia mahajangana]
MDSRSVFLAGQWAESSIQLTDFVKTIKLSTLTFNTLGPDGETYFKGQAQLLLMKPAEFIYDESNPNRIYFGNPTDVQQETRGMVFRADGVRLLMVQPGHGGHQASTNLTTTANLCVGNTRSLNETHSHDNNKTPVQNSALNSPMVPGHPGQYQDHAGPSTRQNLNAVGHEPAQLQAPQSLSSIPQGSINES